MKRFQGNPILEPKGSNPWESRRVFNAAAIYMNKHIHIVYRAMGDDGVSRLGYAKLSDGYHVDERLPFPIFEPANVAEKKGCEDPRLTKLDGRLIMTYTALQELEYQLLYQVSMASITVNDFLSQKWKWGSRLLPFPGIRNKDAILFPRKVDGEYVMFHRLEPDICLAHSNDLRRWCDIESVMTPRLKHWDSWKVGAAGQPIELSEGWLFIYHGADFDKVYSLGVALLDKDDPGVILHRSEEPILTPVEEYEKYGKVPNVVFSCGNALIDNQILIYYGGADSVLCVATYDLSELLPRK